MARALSSAPAADRTACDFIDPVTRGITDPKIKIEEAWHRDRRTGVICRLLLLLAPLAAWQALPSAERDKWAATQRGRVVQAHRLIFP